MAHRLLLALAATAAVTACGPSGSRTSTQFTGIGPIIQDDVDAAQGTIGSAGAEKNPQRLPPLEELETQPDAEAEADDDDPKAEPAWRRVKCTDATTDVDGLTLSTAFVGGELAARGLPRLSLPAAQFKSVPSVAIDPRDPSVAYVTALDKILRGDVCRDEKGHVLAIQDLVVWASHDSYEQKSFSTVTFSPDGRVLYANLPITYRGTDEPLKDTLYVFDMTAAKPSFRKTWCGGPDEGIAVPAGNFSGLDCTVAFATPTAAKAAVRGHDGTHASAWLNVLDARAASYKADSTSHRLQVSSTTHLGAVYARTASKEKIALVVAFEVNTHVASLVAYQLNATHDPVGAGHIVLSGLSYTGAPSIDPLTGDVFVPRYDATSYDFDLVRVSGLAPAL